MEPMHVHIIDIMLYIDALFVDVSFEGKLLSLLFFGFSGRYFLVSRNLEGPS